MEKISGLVIRGKQRGRTLGFPTANLQVEAKPESGVYAGEVILENQKYPAAVFIPNERNLVEAHILDFSQDIYGKTIEVIVGKKIREVGKFQSDEELKKQIILDLECLRRRN